MKPGHFKFEAKLMVWGLLVFIGLTIIASMILPWFMEQVAIDRCLDAGGSYNYQSDVCKGE